jgi:exopolysaccharide biosynthesis protein
MINCNGVKLSTKEQSINGTLYVPVRDIAYALNKNVEWDATTNTATIVDRKVSNSVQKFSYYNIFNNVSVVEIDPRCIFAVETQKATNKTPYNNFVNGAFFMNQKSGVMFPQGMIVNAGQVMSNYMTHGKPVATIIVHAWNNVKMEYISDITKVKDVWFAYSGYGIYPNVTADIEGFTGDFADVTRTTDRPILGYRSSDNKIVIAVGSNMSAKDASILAKNLCLDFAISLDGGGSATLKVNGEYKFSGDNRQLYGGIIWS